jgi:hypothetical protein
VRPGVAAIALALFAAPSALASITVATNAARPALRVDAKGNAEVSWTAGGARRTLLLPVRGRVLPGARLPGADVSRPATAPAVPFRRVLRTGRGGSYYALQSWRVVPGGSVELRFSRWRGAPTSARLVAESTSTGVLLTGTATFAGRPVPTTSRTPEGKVQRQYVYLDRLVGGSWSRIGGVVLRADGSFRRLVAGVGAGSRYHAAIPGPNIAGVTYAPDAAAVATAS